MEVARCVRYRFVGATEVIRRSDRAEFTDPDRYDLSAEQAAARPEQLQHIPCYERPNLAGRDVLTQIAENGERLSLTEAERARGLQLALVDGLDARAISRATGIKLATVRAAGESRRTARGRAEGTGDRPARARRGGQPRRVRRRRQGRRAHPARCHIGYALAEERRNRDRKVKGLFRI